MGAKSSQSRGPGLNKSDGHLLEYFRQTFGAGGGGTNEPGPQSGLTATGGVISDYTDGSTVYRAHIFTSSGTFDVTEPGNLGDTVDYLVIGGGGGGGNFDAGGGGAGLLRYATGVTVAVGPYGVTIGAGGASGELYPGGAHSPGSQSVLSLPSAVTSPGGGGGAPYQTDGGPGGSGGGGGGNPGRTVAPGTGDSGHPGEIDQTSPANGWGNDGAVGTPNTSAAPTYGGGGGGAATAGDNGITSPYPTARGGAGGDGARYSISGTTRYYAGGGGGGAQNNPVGNPLQPPGGQGGGGDGGYGASVPADQSLGDHGEANTGSGGGGGGQGNPPNSFATTAGGTGGSGIVVVRYQIGQLTATAKATGGAISFYGGKTIHTFTNSGTFTAPASFSETCEYVVLGGGASGGACAASNGGGGGGGGAGSYRTGTTPISGPSSTSIQVGAGGASPNTPGNAHGRVGTPSYFGTPITAPTGGYGAMADASPKTGGGPGGSGGGGGGGGSTGTNANAGPSTGASFPGTIGSSPTAGWGHDGGAGVTAGQGYSGGGGGGAGGGGVTGTSGTNSKGGNGGLGIQLPSSFRNPSSTVGHSGPTSPSVTGADTSGKYYVAGGGGGGVNPLGGGSPDKGYGGVGPGTTTDPFAGAGNAGKNAPGSDATENSGSGGGGTGGDGAGYSGNGGSGIVLIAYPS
jgi:hypothetical protein